MTDKASFLHDISPTMDKNIKAMGAIQNYATHFFNMLVIISNFSLR